jgi:ketosteroid isomerase-like protein
MSDNDGHWLDELMSSIDARNAAAFAAFLSNDCSFRFGNAPAISGRDTIEAAVTGFFASVAGLSHELRDRWTVGDVTICTGMVSYLRRDGRSLQVPFANVLKRRAGRIVDYQIFIDNSALFAP